MAIEKEAAVLYKKSLEEKIKQQVCYLLCVVYIKPNMYKKLICFQEDIYLLEAEAAQSHLNKCAIEEEEAREIARLEIEAARWRLRKERALALKAEKEADDGTSAI